MGGTGAAPPPVRAFVGLGSNLGDRIAHLRSGVAGLPGVVRVSGVYETEPVGGPDGQGPYLNIVAELHTLCSAEDLLAIAGRLELEAGRVRTVRHGPRTLDVDILVFGEERIETPDLVVPHPRISERRFVLAPLAELAPEIVSEDALEAAGGEVRRLVDWS
jgi:2-amino-4-hydroxy-6-hydroxymethyldihydropteridine diphosphokinase